MTTDSNVKAYVKFDWRTIRITRGNMTRTYTMQVYDYLRLVRLMRGLPQNVIGVLSHETHIAWYHQRGMIQWTPQYRATHCGYYEVYHDINRAWYTEGSKYNRNRAFHYALNHYGWSDKQFFNAQLDYQEIRSGTQ